MLMCRNKHERSELHQWITPLRIYLHLEQQTNCPRKEKTSTQLQNHKYSGLKYPLYILREFEICGGGQNWNVWFFEFINLSAKGKMDSVNEGPVKSMLFYEMHFFTMPNFPRDSDWSFTFSNVDDVLFLFCNLLQFPDVDVRTDANLEKFYASQLL